MTIIRKFLVHFGNNLTNINNQSLGIINLPSKKRTPIALEKWQQISDPLAKLLLNLQIHFGLTFSETIHLIPVVHVQQNHLWLTREITFNSQDRVVPIRSELQINIINEFNLITKNQHRLIDLYGYRALCFTWSKALKAVRIPVKRSCRYLYAQIIYKQLAPMQSNDKLTNLLLDELGLKSRSTLWGYLRHMNNKQSGKKFT